MRTQRRTYKMLRTKMLAFTIAQFQQSYLDRGLQHYLWIFYLNPPIHYKLTIANLLAPIGLNLPKGTSRLPHQIPPFSSLTKFFEKNGLPNPRTPPLLLPSLHTHTHSQPIRLLPHQRLHNIHHALLLPGTTAFRSALQHSSRPLPAARIGRSRLPSRAVSSRSMCAAQGERQACAADEVVGRAD